jgi:hypothetical protein
MFRKRNVSKLLIGLKDAPLSEGAQSWRSNLNNFPVNKNIKKRFCFEYAQVKKILQKGRVFIFVTLVQQTLRNIHILKQTRCINQLSLKWNLNNLYFRVYSQTINIEGIPDLVENVSST